MRRYILRRLLLMIPTLLGVAVLVFLLMRVVPGDIVEMRFAEGQFFNPELVAKERARFGLDRPLWRQFLDWLWGIVRLDFGLSMWSGNPITHEIAIRLQLSLQLAVMATARGGSPGHSAGHAGGPARRIPGWTMSCACSRSPAWRRPPSGWAL